MMAFREQSLMLARWTFERLVNRLDVWGAYRSDGGVFTAPWPESKRNLDQLSTNTLQNHFAGRRSIGVHCISPDGKCKWVAFDIDRHSEEVDAANNWSMVMAIADAIRDAGLEPVVEDSNGAGGYHVWVLFAEPISVELAYRLAKYIVRQSSADDVESFPKQPKLTGKRFGNWLRIPGKHHRRDHWSRFHDLDAERWLADEDAVVALLNAPINSPDTVFDLIPILPALPKPCQSTRRYVSGEQPVCITDLLQNGIRRVGERNRGLLSLGRYWKASDIPFEDAVARGVAFVQDIPARLTSNTLTDDQIEVNARSVLSAVYGGDYPFACEYVRSHGTHEHPIQCDGAACKFVKLVIPTETATRRRIPTCTPRRRRIPTQTPRYRRIPV